MLVSGLVILYNIIVIYFVIFLNQNGTLPFQNRKSREASISYLMSINFTLGLGQVYMGKVMPVSEETFRLAK